MASREPEDETGSWLDPRWALIVAVVVVVVVRNVIPFGAEILYPLTLFATWVHEMGHGLTGLLVGGSFDSLEIFWNASGLAHGAVGEGWPQALRSIGGLLAPPLVGALVLGFARGPKRASIVLWTLAGLMLLSVPIWIRSVTGFVVIPLVALGFGALAYKGGETTRHLGAQLIGVILGLDTISRIDYLFTAEVHVGGQDLPSDVSNIATAVGGYYLLWGALLAVISLALVAGGVRLAWMSPVAFPKLRWPKRSKDVTSSGGGRSNL
ncbi:MAG: M50 family metallopeptidase [Sandaracinaceae bacterium]|nr:M50 family metallopeptidase [Sandaracinaceae bacterium]